MVKILKLKFGQDSKAVVRSEILKLNSKLKFGQYFEADILVELKLDKFAIRFKSNYFGESTYPLGPLCLWQCFKYKHNHSLYTSTQHQLNV